MTKYFRVFIAIIAILSLTVLAKNEVASAANSAGDPSAPSLVQDPVQRRDDDDCRKRDRHGKCLEKKKPRCKDKHGHCGSVKPPPHHIIIPVTGSYSIGGYCTLTVEIKTPDINLDATIQDPLPRPLPKNLHNTALGCLLKYVKSDPKGSGLLVPSALSPGTVISTICFAATPQKQMQLYFYDVYSAKPSWVPLETTSADGTACAAAIQSGVYVPTFKSK